MVGEGGGGATNNNYKVQLSFLLQPASPYVYSPAPTPVQVTEGNPCIEYIKYIVFPWFSKFEVQRSEANGGNKQYTSVQDMVADYTSGALHPCECCGMREGRVKGVA